MSTLTYDAASVAAGIATDAFTSTSMRPRPVPLAAFNTLTAVRATGSATFAFPAVFEGSRHDDPA